MKCQRCGGTNNVLFVGYQGSAPDPKDADNTEENLPFGKAYLCEDCRDEWFTRQARYFQAEDEHHEDAFYGEDFDDEDEEE